VADVECVVVGAGVVGLAIARALALDGREVVILEAGTVIGSEISSRSSEVVHAGLYYPTGSLKHLLCIAGRERLYAFCRDRGVGCRRLGKLVVATADTQRPALAGLAATAGANGVAVEPVGATALATLEPAVQGMAGLLSPATGIVDSHALMLALLAEAQAQGATLVLQTPVLSGRRSGEGFRIEVAGAEPASLTTRLLVNAAGLGAERLSRRLAGVSAAAVPRIFLAKGVYFTLAGAAPFRRLIYPLPDGASLGVHLTLDLAGRARFGPDVEWVERIDYDVDPARADRFYRAIRTYWPGLPDGALQPGYAGIRPKIQGPGEPQRDFAIHGPSDHGVPGFVALYGIESPGLTCCLAIGELVRRLLAEPRLSASLAAIGLSASQAYSS
jgi:L-2-hydroxyglutarate oxidase LhgO